MPIRLPSFVRSLWIPERISKHRKARRRPADWHESRRARRKMAAVSRKRNRR